MSPEAFVETHKALVFAVAREVKRRQPSREVELEDLVQYGYEGLLHAYRRLREPDPPRVPDAAVVWTYARCAMIDGLQEMGHGRIERLRRELTFEALERADDGAAVHPRHETLQRIFAASLLELAGRVISEHYTIANQEERAVRLRIAQQVVAAVSVLDEPYRTIVHAHYFDQRQLCDIGEELGYRSRRYVSELHHAALARLRQPLIDLSSGLVYAGGSLRVGPQ